MNYYRYIGQDIYSVSRGDIGCSTYEPIFNEILVYFVDQGNYYISQHNLELLSQEEVASMLVAVDTTKPYQYIKCIKDAFGNKEGEILLPAEVAVSGVTFRTADGRSLSLYDGALSGCFRVISSDVELDIIPKVFKEWGAGYTDLLKCANGREYTSVSDFLETDFYCDLNTFPMWSQRFALFQPDRSKNVAGGISIYQNKAKRDKDIRTPYSKVGRAFKAMFPEISDAMLEKWVDAYRAKFPVLNYTLKEGRDGADFKRAYSHGQAPMQNPYTTLSRKSLANSCMRYDFNNLPIHPTEVYASGDFFILWTETETGRIASRCVVYHEEGSKPQAGPVYGVCESSIDMIELKLKDMGAVLYPDSSWLGAKVNKVPHKHGGVIGPFIDGSYQGLKDEGDYLTICKNNHEADYDASIYSGVLGDNNYAYCTVCDEGMVEGDEFTGPDGDCYCEECYNERFRYCNHYDEHVESDGDDGAEANVRPYLGGRNGWLHGWVCQQALEEHYTYCEEEDEWFPHEYVIELADGSGYISTRYLENGGEYVVCEDGVGAYPLAEAGLTVDGEWYTLDWLKQNNYVLNAHGKYYVEEKEAA
jgi:hypothetical protein